MLPKDTIQTIIPYPKQNSSSQEFTSVNNQRGLEAIPLNKIQYDYILFGISSFSILLLLTINHFLRKQDRSFFQNYFLLSYQKSNTEVDIINLLQYIFSSIVIVGIFYYFLRNIFFDTFPTTTLIIYGLVVFLAYLFLKSIFFFAAKILVNNKQIIKEQLHNTIFFNKMGALFLFGILLAAFLLQKDASTTLAYISIVIVIIKVNMQLVANYKILRAHKFSIFHSILYLCTLEVLPIIYFIIVLRALV